VALIVSWRHQMATLAARGPRLLTCWQGWHDFATTRIVRASILTGAWPT
jgi:hypothetical protein